MERSEELKSKRDFALARAPLLLSQRRSANPVRTGMPKYDSKCAAYISDCVASPASSAPLFQGGRARRSASSFRRPPRACFGAQEHRRHGYYTWVSPESSAGERALLDRLGKLISAMARSWRRGSSGGCRTLRDAIQSRCTTIAALSSYQEDSAQKARSERTSYSRSSPYCQFSPASLPASFLPHRSSWVNYFVLHPINCTCALPHHPSSSHPTTTSPRPSSRQNSADLEIDFLRAQDSSRMDGAGAASKGGNADRLL